MTQIGRLIKHLATDGRCQLHLKDPSRRRSFREKEIIVDWPCLCKMGGETVDNLLLHCFFAQDLYLGN
jgi:hypothetical protein